MINPRGVKLPLRSLHFQLARKRTQIL